MLDRTLLHELVNTLPEAAVALAQGSLEHLQTWPPHEPPHMRELREAQLERMRGSIRPGTGGGVGGGGSYRMGPGGRREYGHQSYSYWEDDAVVAVTHRFHAGHELVIEERLRMVDGTKVAYSHEVAGPDGTTDRREITFGTGQMRRADAS